MLVAIDAGHNAYPDIGATGIVQEDILTKELAAKVIFNFKKRNIDTVDVTPYNKRFNSVTASLGYRANRANIAIADIYIALHFNVTPGGTGSEIYAISDKAKIIANKVLNNICSSFGYRNRGIKEENLFVLKYTTMPAILIEGCFIDNHEDINKYDADKMAMAIVDSVAGKDTSNNYPGYFIKYNPTHFDVNVKLIQYKLHIHADGYFGINTLVSIQSFQKAHNLQPDGIVGALTWNKLFN